MSDYAVKIQALLAKAKSSTHEAERESFTAAAERLMVKWGIDEAMLDEAARKAGSSRSKIVQRRYVVEGTSGALIAELVAQRAAFGICGAQTAYIVDRPVWWAVGFEDDLDRMEKYVPSLCEQARAAWKEYLRDEINASPWYYSENDKWLARVAFFSGFGVRVQLRLHAMFQQEQEATTGAELVLRNRRTEIDEAYAQMFPNVKINNGRAQRDQAATTAGHRAGERANINAGAVQS